MITKYFVLYVLEQQSVYVLNYRKQLFQFCICMQFSENKYIPFYIIVLVKSTVPVTNAGAKHMQLKTDYHIIM